MIKTLRCAGIALVLSGNVGEAHAQFFDLKKTYTGSHFAFTHFNPDGINRFIVQFNQMYSSSIASGFSQLKGRELGQTFTTSGFRVIFGKGEKTKFTASSDYAYGGGKDKNEVEFKSGLKQEMILRMRSNQINFSFGVAKNENKIWLEALYCTNLTKLIMEYSTEHLNGVQSYGTEYRLNGYYTATIKTMEFGLQASYKYKKYVFYSRLLLPVIVLGPSKEERRFTDAKTSYPAPNDFPSDYNAYVSDPATYASSKGFLNSGDFKGYSFGFGMFYLFGKEK